MTLRIECWTVDCADPASLAPFWEQALGWSRTFQDDWEVVLSPPAGGAAPDLLLLRVPDDPRGSSRVGKNRVHADLRPDDQEAEVARLESLGARRVDIGQSGEESWVVLADPEGNEFCVLRALREGEGRYEGGPAS